MDAAALPRDIVRCAAEWHALLDGGAEAHELAACEEWCRRDPRHRLALERMRGLDASFAALDESQRLTLRQALPVARTQRRRARRRVAFAVVLLAAAAILGRVPIERGIGTELHVARGELHTVTLADSSTLMVGPDSRLRTRFRDGLREVSLQQGRVLANVAPDTQRAFSVVTPQATATALGTVYAVRVEPRGTQVTVVESRVRVCVRDSGTCADLRAGEAILVANDKLGPIRTVNAVADAAWARGWLEANDLPVTEVLEDLAAWLGQPLLIDAAALRDISVTGSYPLTRPQAALDALSAAAGLTVEPRPDGTLQVSKAR